MMALKLEDHRCLNQFFTTLIESIKQMISQRFLKMKADYLD